MFSDVSGCEARLLTELDHINTPADVFSAFHHPRGRKHAPTFVEQPIGNSCDPDMSRDWPKRTITRWISINPEEVHKSGRVLSLVRILFAFRDVSFSWGRKISAGRTWTYALWHTSPALNIALRRNISSVLEWLWRKWISWMEAARWPELVKQHQPVKSSKWQEDPAYSDTLTL